MRLIFKISRLFLRRILMSVVWYCLRKKYVGRGKSELVLLWLIKAEVVWVCWSELSKIGLYKSNNPREGLTVMDWGEKINVGASCLQNLSKCCFLELLLVFVVVKELFVPKKMEEWFIINNKLSHEIHPVTLCFYKRADHALSWNYIKQT